MIECMEATVSQVISEQGDATELSLEINHRIKKAINYNRLTGKAVVGDRLIVNTTAGTLSLGTGGCHFVLVNLNHCERSLSPGGHGMKLRYTPMQIKVSFTEEDGPGDREIYNKPLNISGKLVFFCELHSMVPPLCACLKHMSRGALKVGYIMTDHAALPAAFSQNIREMKAKELIDTLITTGNAFGGDYECVNIYTALQTAGERALCDAIVVAMGPGITGTGTRYGFSGLEMAFYMDMAYRYGDMPFFIPRIMFKDSRVRHQGMSHHSLTILGELNTAPMQVVLPWTRPNWMRLLLGQVKESGVARRHHLSIQSGTVVTEAMERYVLHTQTMGRGILDDPCFYHAIGAAAKKSLPL